MAEEKEIPFDNFDEADEESIELNEEVHELIAEMQREYRESGELPRHRSYICISTILLDSYAYIFLSLIDEYKVGDLSVKIRALEEQLGRLNSQRQTIMDARMAKMRAELKAIKDAEIRAKRAEREAQKAVIRLQEIEEGT
jgi:hypothetical protein